MSPCRVGDEKQGAFRHAEHDNALLIVALPVVFPFDGKDIVERQAGHLEGNSMNAPVSGGLLVVPFKMLILHKLLVNSSFVKCRETS